VRLFRHRPLGPGRRHVVLDAHGDEQQHAINRDDSMVLRGDGAVANSSWATSRVRLSARACDATGTTGRLRRIRRWELKSRIILTTMN
jgi:hypothetical protein